MGAHSDIGSGCGEAKFQKAHDLIKEMLKQCSVRSQRDGSCIPDRGELMDQYLDMKRTERDNQGRADDDPVVLFRTEAEFNEQIQINNYLAWIKRNYGTNLTTSLRD